jgi:general secretion pathway protein K
MNNRGMVLMSVLWIILIIAFISLTLAASVRVEVAAVQNSFDSERAFFMAKSTAEVLFQSLQKPGILAGSPVRREEGTYVFPFDSGEVRARFESNAGLIDVNAASDALLASMFDSLRLDEQLRNELVDSILDWRDIDDVPHLYGAEVDDYGQVVLGPGRLPRNAPFQSVDELLLVKHMTPQIYYGRIEFDAATNSHRKVPGVRDLLAVSSGIGAVDVNQASSDVLSALPRMSRESVARVMAERDQKSFENLQDLARRVPELENSETLPYMTTETGPSTSIVARAMVQPSGISRTVRLDFRRERKVQVIFSSPPFYKQIEVIQFGRWRY